MKVSHVLVALTAVGFTCPAHAGSSVSDFSEFADCSTAKGTWWTANASDKYTRGHLLEMVVQNGGLFLASDYNKEYVMGKLLEVQNIERVGDGLRIKSANSQVYYRLSKKGKMLSGTMDFGTGINNIEFTCQ